jgi:hypothetical protein
MKRQTLRLNALFCCALILTLQLANAQIPDLAWQKTIGGSSDDVGNAIFPLADGSFISCGSTASSDGDFPANNGDYDAYIIKHDASGNILWQHTYGGSGFDEFLSVVVTNNGGFVAFGSTTSNDGDVSGKHGGYDLWVVRMNSKGKLLDQRCYGGSGDEYASNIINAGENQFVFSCGSNSNDGDVSGNHGDYDAWVVKIDKKGKIIWQKCFGGSDYDDNYQVLKSNDNKLFITGPSLSNDGDVSGNHGGVDIGDAWVVKMNQSGNLLWSKCYGGSGDEYTTGIAFTQDGLAVATGSTSSDGDVTVNYGGFDTWIANVSTSTGDILWEKSFGTSADEAAQGIMSTSDGGLIAHGAVGTAYNYPTWDAQAIKISYEGDEVWTKTFGGSEGELVWSGFENEDGSVVLQGTTNSNDGDVTGQHGEGDSWLVKLGTDGEELGYKCKCGQRNYGCKTPACVAACAPVCSFKLEENGIAHEAISIRVYPNPISQSAVIAFQLANEETVALKIFDLQGRLICTLVNEVMSGGSHHITWDTNGENGSPVSDGIYILHVESTGCFITERLIVTR